MVLTWVLVITLVALTNGSTLMAPTNGSTLVALTNGSNVLKLIDYSSNTEFLIKHFIRKDIFWLDTYIIYMYFST